MKTFLLLLGGLALATALHLGAGEERDEEGLEGKVEEYQEEEVETQPQEVVESKGKRYFEEFFHKKTREERRRRMEELKEMNLSQQRRRREQRRKKKQHRRREATGEEKVRVHRDLPRINCRVRSPAHVVNLLLLIHSAKVRDVVAGRWLRECGGGGGRVPRQPTTAMRYFG